MEIIRRKSELGTYDIELKEDNKVLKIIFGGNLDLYWMLTVTKDNLDIRKEKLETLYETFTITKENYFLYSLFEDLMNDIKEARVYEPHPVDTELEFLYDFEEKELEKEQCKRWNKLLKSNFNYRLLYQEDTIDWHSDEEEYSVADFVKITKLDETFLLEFTRPPLIKDKYEFRLPRTITIRFRNSGSRYDPFNIIFMRMFRKLEEYDPDFHQIHIEELEYQKKLTKKRENKNS